MEDLVWVGRLIEQGKFSEAEAALLPLLDGGNIEALHYHGCLLMKQRKLEEAQGAFQMVLAQESEHVRALFNLASINMENGKLTEAKEQFEKVKQIMPDVNIPDIGNRKLVYIGIPNYGKVDVGFMESLIALILSVRPQDNIGLVMRTCSGSRITSNRNRLVKDAQLNNATHILFIDSDMMFPADALSRLMSHDKDIVGATACKRGDEDGAPIGTAAELNEGAASGESHRSVSGGLHEMVVLGSCFKLIKMSVFDKVGLPAYYEPPNPDIEDAYGEDVTFCHLAREKGFKIWMDFDLSIQMGHIGEKVYRIKPKKKFTNEQIAEACQQIIKNHV